MLERFFKSRVFNEARKIKGKAGDFLLDPGRRQRCRATERFVRLSLCNLKCVWCDTPYTWDWGRYRKSEEIIDFSVDAVLGEIKKFPCKNIVLTGGEPLLQQKELIVLMRTLKKEGYRLDVETNMTLLPLPEFDVLIDQYNGSPKLKNALNKKSLCEKPEILKFFAKNPKAIFKFVVGDPDEIEEILEFAKKYGIPKNKIYLMPQARSQKDLLATRSWLKPLCQKNRFLFSTRLHIEKYGDQRGV